MADEIKKTENAAEMDWDSPIEADVGSTNLPPIGEYGFTVTELEKTFSSSGNRMAKVTLELDKSGQFSIEYKNASGRVEYYKKPGDKVQYIECDGRVETEACTWNWASSDQQSIKIDTRASDFGNKFLSDKSNIGVKFYTSGVAHLTIYTKITGNKNYNAYVDFTLK